MKLTLYQDSRAPGRCRSCGAAIEWAELTTGKRTPFNRIVPLRANPVLFAGARVIEEVDTASSPTHFESCPDAKEWRRR
jgi:hypothetical protein